jgi:hypothetical protein
MAKWLTRWSAKPVFMGSNPIRCSNQFSSLGSITLPLRENLCTCASGATAHSVPGAGRLPLVLTWLRVLLCVELIDSSVEVFQIVMMMGSRKSRVLVWIHVGEGLHAVCDCFVAAFKDHRDITQAIDVESGPFDAKQELVTMSHCDCLWRGVSVVIVSRRALRHDVRYLALWREVMRHRSFACRSGEDPVHSPPEHREGHSGR